jgi:hypothetical protein
MDFNVLNLDFTYFTIFFVFLIKTFFNNKSSVNGKMKSKVNESYFLIYETE